VASSAVKIAKRSSLLIFGEFFRMPLGLVSLAYFVRSLTLTDYGIVVAFDVGLSLLRLICDPGLYSAIVTYGAEGVGKGMNVAGLFRKLVLASLSFSSVASLAVLLGGRNLADFFLRTSISPIVIQLVSADVLLTTVTELTRGALEGLNDFRSLTISATASYYVRQLSGVLFVMMGNGIAGVISGWLLGDILFLFESVFAVNRDLKPLQHLARYSPNNRDLIKFCLPVYANGFISFISGKFDQLFVVAFFTADVFALYSVANSILSFVGELLLTVPLTLLPHLAEQHVKLGKSRLQAEVRDASRYVSLIFTPVFLGLATVSGPVISIVSGPKYAEAAILLTVLCGVETLTLSGEGFGQVFSVLKRTEMYTVFKIVSVASALFFSLLLVRPFGILGIAMARELSSLSVFAIQAISLIRIAEIRLEQGPLVKILTSGVAMALIVYIVQVLYYSVELLPIYVALGAISYFVALRQLRVFRKRDFDNSRTLLGGRLKFIVDILERAALRTPI
jgi:O-antigen/teichoic acid export membrane protein